MEEMSLEEAIELLNWLQFELKFIKGNNEKMTENIRLTDKGKDNNIYKEMEEEFCKWQDNYIEIL